MDGGPWWTAVHGVAKSQTWLSNFTFTFNFHALEKEMATHSSIPAWEIAWTEMPGGLQSIGWQRVRYDWATEHVCMRSKKHRGLHSFTNTFPQLSERWNGNNAEKSVAKPRTHPSGTVRIRTQHSSCEDSFPAFPSILQWSDSRWRCFKLSLNWVGLALSGPHFKFVPQAILWNSNWILRNYLGFL